MKLKIKKKKNKCNLYFFFFANLLKKLGKSMFND